MTKPTNTPIQPPEHRHITIYSAGDECTKDGEVYVSLSNTNIGKDMNDEAHWRRKDE